MEKTIQKPKLGPFVAIIEKTVRTACSGFDG
jgi:hypothetical protein